MAADTAPARARRMVRVRRPVRTARHPAKELAAEALALPAAREAARTSHLARAEAVPAKRSRASGRTAPTASPQESRLARVGRPAPALRYPQSKLSAQAVQAEATRLRITGTEGMTATAMPRSRRAVRVRRAERAKRAVPAERPVPAARCLAKQLATEAVALPRSQAKPVVLPQSQAGAAALPVSEAEAEQEAGADSQTSPRLRAEALAAEPRRFPVA